MKIEWDQTGEKYYEAGVDHGVLYLKENPFGEAARARAHHAMTRIAAPQGYTYGVPWNGLVSVNDNPSGAEPNKHYADNIPYLTLMSAEDLGLSIEAFTYPREFEVCEGVREMAPGIMVRQQKREMFSFAYRSKVGNDEAGEDFGYKLHLYYGCLASPSSRNYQTINESPEPLTFSWDVTTNPINIPGFAPTAGIILNTAYMTEEQLAILAKVEEILYGTDTTEPRMVMPEELSGLLVPPSGEAAAAMSLRNQAKMTK